MIINQFSHQRSIPPLHREKGLNKCRSGDRLSMPFSSQTVTHVLTTPVLTTPDIFATCHLQPVTIAETGAEFIDYSDITSSSSTLRISLAFFSIFLPDDQLDPIHSLLIQIRSGLCPPQSSATIIDSIPSAERRPCTSSASYL